MAFAVPTRRKLLAADATTGSPQATGTTSPETRALEQQMLELVNEDRADAANFAETHGQAQPLIWDERLAEVARARSEDMIARNYFGHVDPDGFTPDVHLTMAGIRWTAMSENIVIRTTVERGEAAFMDEPRFDPNHRGAILNGQLTHVGIGVIAAPNGELYITQEFARY
ncbi:MAG: CAP domain-containing protein [Terriglobia bacterium]